MRGEQRASARLLELAGFFQIVHHHIGVRAVFMAQRGVKASIGVAECARALEPTERLDFILFDPSAL